MYSKSPQSLPRSRAAQGGMNAAVLVAIIAGLIILYIIFLPTSEREALLNDGQGTGSTGSAEVDLLREFPGRLSTASGLESTKRIPDVYLVETTDAKVLKNINPFIIRKGWFSDSINLVEFTVQDQRNTENVVLSFNTRKREGVLTIRLNGEVIFEGELTTDNIDPVSLDGLQERNTLEFSVSSVGAKFWATNEYQFDNVRVIGDITDKSRQQSNNIFTILGSEHTSLVSASLNFIPYCGNVNELGTLDVHLNNKLLFSTVPVCDNSYRQSIPIATLSEGENNIVFKTSRGSYSVEQIKINLVFENPQAPSYYFHIDKQQFESVRQGGKDVQLKLKFAGTRNRAKLTINGFLETVDTTNPEFSKIINNRVSEGNNFVRLEPFDNLEVLELSVQLV
jgi:hypothetical protein